jgi:hypothetical protein
MTFVSMCLGGLLYGAAAMPKTQLLDYVPLWLLFTATIVVVLIAIEGGYRLGRFRRGRAEDEREAPVGGIIAATLGLLAFVLAFTFGLAAARFDARRQIVLQEAGVLRTTYLRAGFLPEGQRTTVRKLLRDYVDARLEAVRRKDVHMVLQRSEEIHRALWSEAEALERSEPSSVATELFTEAVNATINIHAERLMVSLDNRLPALLWATLYFVTALTMAGVGYHEGLTNSRRSLAILGLVLSFSAIMALIADLDRPQEGFLTISPQPMIDLRTTMGEMP